MKHVQRPPICKKVLGKFNDVSTIMTQAFTFSYKSMRWKGHPDSACVTCYHSGSFSMPKYSQSHGNLVKLFQGNNATSEDCTSHIFLCMTSCPRKTAGVGSHLNQLPAKPHPRYACTSCREAAAKLLRLSMNISTLQKTPENCDCFRVWR